MATPAPGLDDVVVDRRAEIPLGTQLVWALRARIGDRRLAAGQRLPGVRELAARFGINVNTARAIYQRLEHDGLIESRQGTGTFVAEGANPDTGVGELAQDAARRARELGVDPRELASALYVAAKPSDPVNEESERRRNLRGQITALEQALIELETANPGLLAPPKQSARMAGPRLLSADELEQVRDWLVRRLTDARLALDAYKAQTAEPAASQPKAKTATATAKQAADQRSAPKTRGSASPPRPSARPSIA